MDVLVTGGAGFIGSNIVERLVRDGYKVSVIDNLHTGNKQNLKDVMNSINFRKGNAGELGIFNKRFDIIFHQGIYSSSPMYKENPLLVADALQDFTKIMEYAKKHSSKVVFASSSSVYNGLKPPHREDMQLLVTDYYTEGRIAMERLAELYNKLYGVKVIALRYFSVYGPHEEFKKQYANLITQFLWAMQKDQPLVVYGDGSQKRDFVYVEDVVEANIKAASTIDKIGFGIYNVGTGKNYSINEMINILQKELGKQAKVSYVENKIKNYVQETLADTKKAETELGFKTTINLGEGIKNLLIC